MIGIVSGYGVSVERSSGYPQNFYFLRGLISESRRYWYLDKYGNWFAGWSAGNGAEFETEQYAMAFVRKITEPPLSESDLAEELAAIDHDSA